MKQIKEIYLKLDETSIQTVYIPADSEIIGAKTISEYPSTVILLVLTSSLDSSMTLKKFKICDTNETVYNCNLSYIDSCIVDSKLKHVLEIL